MATIDADKVLDFLNKKSVPCLGSGLFSSVFAKHGSDRVVKVQTGYGGNDSWPDYIIWATKNGYAGTLAPKVYSLHFIQGGYVATMERLISIKDETPLSKQSRTNWLHYCDARWDKRGVPQQFSELHNFITDIGKQFGYGLDLHLGNVMCRTDGSLVITDPVTHSDYSEHLPRRMRAFDIAWTRNAKFQSERSIRK